jgi:Fe-S cluster assembly protein SufD
MSDTLTASDTSLSAARFNTHLAQRSYLPAWWTAAKQEAWNEFIATPMPARNHENWRFANLNGLSLDGFTVPEEHANLVPHLPNFPHAAEIIFSNRQLVGRTSLSRELIDQGVIFAPIDEALRDHPDLVRRYFQQHPVKLGSEKFIALNIAFAASGSFLYVPKGVKINLPLVVQHTVSGDKQSVFPHTIVALEDEAEATLVEFFVSGDKLAHLASGVNDLHAGQNAKLTYVGAQNWSHQTLSFQANSLAAQRDARITCLNIHLGGRQSRHESHSRLIGPGAHCDMLALTVAKESQEFDQRTLQSHQAPHTTSDLLYKNALLDKAKTIFSGLIVVDPDAQQTDAYQTNRNLLLSDNAESNSLPGLEIQANDVKCSHGATSGRVPEEQLFYLTSRGIDPEKAHELIVFGFFEEVLNKLENEHLHAVLSDLIQSKFKK